MLRRPALLLVLLRLLTPSHALAGWQQPDTFADSGARDLLLHALALRDSAAAGLESYEATATERMHVGMQVTRRLPLRSRTLYHREQVARVYWQSRGNHRVRLLGRRTGTPLMGDEWAERAPFGLDFDLAEELDLDDLGIDLLFDPLGDRMDVFEAGFVQPVSGEGLRLYRFRSGDTLQIRLPLPERSITLVEVVVTPRTDDWEAVEGSLWFDRDTGVLVRAAFRPSDVWDMEVREPGDLDDVPGFLKPAIGTVTSIVLEYALFDGRWWLPRRVLVDGVFDWGHGLVRMPLIMEWTLSGHVVNEAASAQLEPGPGDTVIGLDRSIRNDFHGQAIRFRERDADLAQSSVLPPPISDVNLISFSRAELEPLVERITQVAGPTPPGRSPAALPMLARSLRYDRVRGISTAVEWRHDLGPFRMDGRARVASAVPTLFADAGIAYHGLEVRAYHRLANASDWNVDDGGGNAVATLLFGHDGSDPYRAWGISLGRARETGRMGVDVDAFLEDQRPIARQTNVSLATIGGGSLRPNLEAQPVKLFGVRGAVAGQLGSDPAHAILNGRLWMEAAGGTAEYVRVAASARITGTPFAAIAVSTELSGGFAGSGAPVQRHFLLGGAGTLRGVEENAVRGPAFWMFRSEAGTSLAGARAVLFTDVGWAGARDGISRSQPAAGAGIGASFLDGLFRFDIARGVLRSDAWRLYFYLDALL